MSNSWCQAHRALTDFIAEHTEIEIGASEVENGVSVVRIPENIRSEFYRLFNAVRAEFVEEKLTDLVNEAKSLSEEYTKLEGRIIKLLDLEKISLAVNLHRFLHNPFDELVRELLDPLFDLLKGKIDVTAFEQVSSKKTRDSFRNLYRSGYEKWVALSLVELLEADKLFRVTPREFRSVYDRLFTGSASSIEEVPVPEESSRLSLDRGLITTLKAPSFIVHSAKANKYVALGSEIGEALVTAENASEAREWYHLDSIAVFTSGSTLIYLADKPEEISLIADVKKICRPDLIIECEGNKDWYGVERMEKIKLQHNALKPILGTYVVSRKPMPEKAYKYLMLKESVSPTLGEEKPEQGDARHTGIHILTVGFGQSKLAPIIDAFIRNTDNDK